MKAIYTTKRIYLNPNHGFGVKITFPHNKDKDPIYGEQVRLYGSSRILKNVRQNLFYVETENQLLLDGNLIE